MELSFLDNYLVLLKLSQIQWQIISFQLWK
nr:MAG TPA: hypothetical protein [Caudoviricetes sp.]